MQFLLESEGLRTRGAERICFSLKAGRFRLETLEEPVLQFGSDHWKRPIPQLSQAAEVPYYSDILFYPGLQMIG